MIGTTHRQSKLPLLHESACDEYVLDDGSLRGKVVGVTKALELIGIKNRKGHHEERGAGRYRLPYGRIGKGLRMEPF